MKSINAKATIRFLTGQEEVLEKILSNMKGDDISIVSQSNIVQDKKQSGYSLITLELSVENVGDWKTS